jgi:16S rRNA (adenine1518-N6/adenine1519-N6)-dimethyltransferase
VRRNRELGQNFLRDRNILGVISRLAELESKDVVLEIGSGEGVLAAYLAPTVAWLHTVEVDERLRGPLLEALAPYENVSVYWADAMRVELAGMRPYANKVVANLPYGIAAGVILRTIEELAGVKLWLVMVQREVGERLAAGAGSGVYGVTSVLAQLAGEVRVVRQIPRTVFAPVPNVDSVLVKIERRGAAASPTVNRVVHGAFAHRRKALARSLVLSGFERNREAIRAALLTIGHPEDERAERLEPQEFVALARELGLEGAPPGLPAQASAGIPPEESTEEPVA